MNVLLFAPDPLNIMKLVLEEEKHTIWSRKTRRRRPLFDLAILKTGELREYDKFKARCVISFIRPPIDRLPEYYFYTFDLWPTQFGIPLSEPYTIYIGTHRSIELLPETFLDTFKTGNSDIGLTTRENEYFYLLYRNPGERRVFSSRYPLPHPQPKMYLKTMKKYTRHNADPVDFEGLTFCRSKRTLTFSKYTKTTINSPNASLTMPYQNPCHYHCSKHLSKESNYTWLPKAL